MDKINKTIEDRKKMLFSIILLMIGFSLIAILVFTGNFNHIDTYMHSYILKIRSDELSAFLKLITEFGGASLLLAISVLTLIFFKKKKTALLILINLVLSFLLNETAKSIFTRTRPIGIMLILEDGYSFPSGHSMVSLAFYGFIIYLIHKNVDNKLFKSIIIILLVSLIILIGFSRIYLGVHYLSDVIAGFLLALLYLILFTNIAILKE